MLFYFTNEEIKKKWLRDSRLYKWANSMNVTLMWIYNRCLHRGGAGRNDEKRKEERRLKNGKS